MQPQVLCVRRGCARVSRDSSTQSGAHLFPEQPISNSIPRAREAAGGIWSRHCVSLIQPGPAATAAAAAAANATAVSSACRFMHPKFSGRLITAPEQIAGVPADPTYHHAARVGTQLACSTSSRVFFLHVELQCIGSGHNAASCNFAMRAPRLSHYKVHCASHAREIERIRRGSEDFTK